MKWNGYHFVLADVLASELVGVQRNDASDDWTLHYGPLELGRVDAKGRFKRKPA